MIGTTNRFYPSSPHVIPGMQAQAANTFSQLLHATETHVKDAEEERAQRRSGRALWSRGVPVGCGLRPRSVAGVWSLFFETRESGRKPGTRAAESRSDSERAGALAPALTCIFSLVAGGGFEPPTFGL